MINKKSFLIGLLLVLVIIILITIIFNKQKPSTAQDSIPVITKAPPGAQLIDVPKDFFDEDSVVSPDDCLVNCSGDSVCVDKCYNN